MKFANITLYAGEVKGYNHEPDCFEFNTCKEAAEWLVQHKYAPNVVAARTGISNVINDRLHHYKGFTVVAVPLLEEDRI